MTGVRARALPLLDAVSASFVLAVVGAFGGVLSTRCALRDPRFGLMPRLALFGAEAVAAGLVLAVIAVLVTGFAIVRARVSPRAARALGSVGFVATVLLVLVYGSSWSLFSTVGQFLDAVILKLVAVDSVMLFKHLVEMSPVRLFVVPLGAVAVAVLLRSGYEWLSVLSPARGRALHRGSAAGALVAVALAAKGEVSFATSAARIEDKDRGATISLGELYRYARRFRTGPFSHGLLSLLPDDSNVAPAVAGKHQPITPLPIRTEHRPILPLRDYVSRAQSVPYRQLDVIVVLVESLRPDMLRATGGHEDVMPATDRLAASSRVFPTAYAEASHSDYADLCPLSGHYPLRSRQHHYYPKDPPYPRVLIYDVLKALGYRTAIVSSQNEKWGDMYNYLDTGNVDHFFHAETFHSTVIDPEDTVFSQWAKDFGHSGKVDDRYTIDEAIRWVGESKKPYFLYINLQNSHFPYRTPDDFPKRFSPNVVDFQYTFGRYPRDKLDVVKNRYKNALSYMDAQLARLYEFLERTGRLERTVFVITGDNGEAFFEHGTAAHAGPVFEEAVRIAFFVHAPGLAPGVDVRPVEHIDVPPTVLGVLGLPPHPAYQGHDATQVPADPRRSIYLLVQTGAHQAALVREGYKLIADFDFGRYFLYDLATDPGETRDLTADDEPRLRKMAGRLGAWQKAQLDYYGDPDAERTTYPPVLSDEEPP